VVAKISSQDCLKTRIFLFIFDAMKFFAFIMASLMLVLSILPCADEGIDMKEEKVKTEITSQHSQQEDQEHNDACSPFCHCTCCAGFSINHPFAAESSLILIDNKFYTSYLPENLIKFSSPVWQPPKIS
jgi:hypothetical protein